MGGWFLSFAIANYAGGLIASITGGHSESNEELSALDGLHQYTDVFTTIGLTCVELSLLPTLNKPLNK